MRAGVQSLVCSLIFSCATASTVAQVADPVGLPSTIGGTPPSTSTHAMVVMIHHDASDIGVGLLKAGGNAVDAAVASALRSLSSFPGWQPDVGSL
jgi:gamma-glutamyltranspeptidase / glutathione hydrolase